MTDTQFSEKIILLNKEIVHLSTNAKSNEFLSEMIVLNILLLWSYKEVVL